MNVELEESEREIKEFISDIDSYFKGCLFNVILILFIILIIIYFIVK